MTGTISAYTRGTACTYTARAYTAGTYLLLTWEKRLLFYCLLMFALYGLVLTSLNMYLVMVNLRGVCGYFGGPWVRSPHLQGGN